MNRILLTFISLLIAVLPETVHGNVQPFGHQELASAPLEIAITSPLAPECADPEHSEPCFSHCFHVAVPVKGLAIVAVIPVSDFVRRLAVQAPASRNLEPDLRPPIILT